MGALFIEHDSKGFTGMVDQHFIGVYDDEVAPALQKLNNALMEFGNDDGEQTKITITVHGKEDHTFCVDVHNLTELQEILQWTLGGK